MEMQRPIPNQTPIPNADRLLDVNQNRKLTHTFEGIPSTLRGMSNSESQGEKTWNDIVAAQIEELTKRYSGNSSITKILENWHKNVTIDYKYNLGFTPHISGFYMIFMVHGTWYDMYHDYVSSSNQIGLSEEPDGKKFSGAAETQMQTIGMNNPYRYMNM
jgi:hypothetical protein